MSNKQTEPYRVVFFFFLLTSYLELKTAHKLE